MAVLNDTSGEDNELLVYAMTLVNKVGYVSGLDNELVVCAITLDNEVNYLGKHTKIG